MCNIGNQNLFAYKGTNDVRLNLSITFRYLSYSKSVLEE